MATAHCTLLSESEAREVCEGRTDLVLTLTHLLFDRNAASVEKCAFIHCDVSLLEQKKFLLIFTSESVN